MSFAGDYFDFASLTMSSDELSSVGLWYARLARPCSKVGLPLEREAAFAPVAAKLAFEAAD